MLSKETRCLWDISLCVKSMIAYSFSVVSSVRSMDITAGTVNMIKYVVFALVIMQQNLVSIRLMNLISNVVTVSKQGAATLIITLETLDALYL